MKGEGEHEAVKRCTRRVQDIDVAKSAKGCGMVGSPGAEGPTPGGEVGELDKAPSEDYSRDYRKGPAQSRNHTVAHS